MPLLVDLADEFHLTTTEALALCDLLDIEAEGLGSVLSENDAEAFRDAVARGLHRAEPDDEPGPATPSLAASLGATPAAPASAPISMAKPGDAPTPPAAPVPGGWAASAGPRPGFTPEPERTLTLIQPRRIDRIRAAIPQSVTDNIIVVAIGGAAILLLLGFIALSGGGGGGDTEGQVASTDLIVGDCFDPVGDADLATAELGLVVERRCGEPHRVEIISEVRTFGGRFQTDVDAYPGRDALVADGASRCLGTFEDEVGVPLAASGLEVVVIVPTEATFESPTERVSLCGVTSADGAPLDGTAVAIARAAAGE